MKVRVSEPERLEGIFVDIETLLVGIAKQNGLIAGARVGRITPHELIRGLDDDGGLVELDRPSNCGETQKCSANERDAADLVAIGHWASLIACKP
jgi:hypothetical protein